LVVIDALPDQPISLNTLPLPFELHNLQLPPHAIILLHQFLNILLEPGILVPDLTDLPILLDLLYFGAHPAHHPILLELPILNGEIQIVLLQRPHRLLKPFDLG
jgi:hypothetical protein